MFKKYDTKIRKILEENVDGCDWEGILNQHRRMIKFIQHERIVHLLVTFFVGIVTTMSAFMIILTENFSLLALFAPLLMLFVAYLWHYRFLENVTQGWYRAEEEIMTRLS